MMPRSKLQRRDYSRLQQPGMWEVQAMVCYVAMNQIVCKKKRVGWKGCFHNGRVDRME